MIKKGPFFNTIAFAFGVSAISQLLGILRQILIAAYFGVSGDLDIYFMTYAIAMVVVFTFGTIFDTIITPHLVATLEKEGETVFKRLTGSIFTFSIILAFILSAVFIIAIPLITKFVTLGFSVADKDAVKTMALYFLPWTLIYLPYCALCSFFKSIRHFNIVFLGELIISVCTVIALAMHHPTTRFLPTAYFIGYLCAISILLTVSIKYFYHFGGIFTYKMKRIYRNLVELFGANQVSSLSSLVERFLQSFLPSGGISALSYSFQITQNMSVVLGFREIFLVPLSATKERAKKLERAAIGLTLITVPIMLFCSSYARELVILLFKRGRFDIDAATITGSALSLYMLTLLPAVVGLPGLRMFQILGRVRKTAFVYLFSLINFMVFGSFFTFYLKAGVMGLAWTVALNAYLVNSFTFYLLHRYGVCINFFRVFKYVAYALAGSFAALFLSKMACVAIESTIFRLLATLSVYALLVCAAYLVIKTKIISIVYGEREV